MLSYYINHHKIHESYCSNIQSFEVPSDLHKVGLEELIEIFIFKSQFKGI